MRWVAYALLALCQLTSAAKKKTKSFEESTSFSVKFINEVDGPVTLYCMGKRIHQFKGLGDAHQLSNGEDGHMWTGVDANGKEIFKYVVRQKDGPDQIVHVKAGVTRRTIHDIVNGDDHELHRVDGHEKMQSNAGCPNPVIAGDQIRVFARSLDARGEDVGAGYLAYSDHKIVVISDTDATPEEIANSVFTVESDADGPLFPGANLFLKNAKRGLYVDAPPPHEGKHAPLLVRWEERGTWQRFLLFKGEEHDDAPLSAVCYGDDAYLLAHDRNFVDVNDGAAYSRWRHRGAWQRLAFVRYVPKGANDEL